MTATMLPDPVRLASALEREQAAHAEAEREVRALRAAVLVLVDELVERQLIARDNSFYPPTADERAEIADQAMRHWLGVVEAAAHPLGVAS